MHLGIGSFVLDERISGAVTLPAAGDSGSIEGRSRAAAA
jgi:hypothetical protein